MQPVDRQKLYGEEKPLSHLGENKVRSTLVRGRLQNHRGVDASGDTKLRLRISLDPRVFSSYGEGIIWCSLRTPFLRNYGNLLNGNEVPFSRLSEGTRLRVDAESSKG